MQYKLRTPVTREDLAPLRTGDTVLLSGAVYTARDAAHKRMMELLDAQVDKMRDAYGIRGRDMNDVLCHHDDIMGDDGNA